MKFQMTQKKIGDGGFLLPEDWQKYALSRLTGEHIPPPETHDPLDRRMGCEYEDIVDLVECVLSTQNEFEAWVTPEDCTGTYKILSVQENCFTAENQSIDFDDVGEIKIRVKPDGRTIAAFYL